MAYYSVGPAIFESVSAVTDTPSVEIGTRVNYAGNEYVYVQAKTAITRGCGCQPYLTAGYSYLVENIGTVLAASNLVFAGLVEHTTMSTDSYGWLLINGVGTFTSTNSTITTTGQKVSVHDNGGVATWTGTYTTGAFAGYLLNATVPVATGATANVWIKSEIY